MQQGKSLIGKTISFTWLDDTVTGTITSQKNSKIGTITMVNVPHLKKYTFEGVLNEANEYKVTAISKAINVASEMRSEKWKQLNRPSDFFHMT